MSTALVLAAALTVQTSTGSAWRENLWRETAILNETLYERESRRNETLEKQLYSRNRALHKCESRRTSGLRIEPEGTSPFVWVAVGGAIIGVAVAGFAIGRATK